MISIVLGKDQNYGGGILWRLRCGSVVTVPSCNSVCLCVCVQMFVMAVTQEANGRRAKTTPQRNVCQTIPGHKCMSLLWPLFILLQPTRSQSFSNFSSHSTSFPSFFWF